MLTEIGLLIIVITQIPALIWIRQRRRAAISAALGARALGAATPNEPVVDAHIRRILLAWPVAFGVVLVFSGVILAIGGIKPTITDRQLLDAIFCGLWIIAGLIVTGVSVVALVIRGTVQRQ